MVEDVKFGGTQSDSTVFTGVVRGKGLNADRLVQVGEWGTFQIEKITSAPLATNKKKRGAEDSMAVDEVAAEEVLGQPTEDQDQLAELAPEEAKMDEDEEMDAVSTMTSSKKGVLLDDHHYFSDDDDQVVHLQAPKRLPRGTSKYQSAWFLDGDNASDSGSDLEDMEMDDDEEEEEEAARPEDGVEGMAGPAMTEAGETEYAKSIAFVEPDEQQDAMELEAYRKLKRTEAEDDLEFPDEIELHPNVLARERLAKYRGLKSLRSSPWIEEEDRAYEPEEWQRLLRIPNYQASRIQAARETLVGGVAPGTRVHVYLKGVPSSVQESCSPGRPVTLVSLLRHEHKRTAMNIMINLSSDYPTSIKAKEEMIVQYGPRRFVVKPVFSQSGNTPNDVHKFCRFLHPGQSAVATFMGPVAWGSIPALFFKRTVPGEVNEDGEEISSVPLTLVATGTTLPPSTSRVIAKRVVLTGHPYHIHKKVVTVRYMFFNREDVEWFKALPMWTRRGRSGFIKEPLGTHGYFKCTFDGRINPQDSIGVSLYKRVWPRYAQPLQGSLLDPDAVPQLVRADEDAMDADVE